ncbi:MAG: hypothetical protein IJW44_01725 [Clostridia bacterium]|nr:hypothetical protein [Clostridia bacterium]
MKKRLLLCLLCLALIGSMMSCDKNTDTSQDAQSTSDSGTDSQLEIPKEPTYKDVPRITSKTHQSVYLSYGEGLRVFRFMMPDTWTLTAEPGGYSIQRENRVIGSIKTGASQPDTLGEAVHKDDFFFLDCTMDYFVHKSEKDGVAEYCHRFVFGYPEQNGTKRTYTILVDLEELDEYSVNRIFYSFREEQATNQAAMGILSLPENPSILIIGNSFVNSSQIGSIMNSMGGVDCQAVSIDYLTVRRLCSDYTSYLDNMRSGAYDAVFLCGFYATDDATQMKTVVDACRASQTELIVFPAHNENTTAIAAAEKNSYVKVLNWKSEIDIVSEQLNVPMKELRVDDTHGHSRPLAGYIGAHMIYRAIFGKVPPTRDTYGSLDHSYVYGHLGSYMTDPVIELIPSDEILYLQ